MVRAQVQPQLLCRGEEGCKREGGRGNKGFASAKKAAADKKAVAEKLASMTPDEKKDAAEKAALPFVALVQTSQLKLKREMNDKTLRVNGAAVAYAQARRDGDPLVFDEPPVGFVDRLGAMPRPCRACPAGVHTCGVRQPTQ